MRKVLLDLQKQNGMTIVNTSHNMADVHELCDRILFMRKGKIIAQGTTAEILDQFASTSLEEVFITIARS